MGRPTKLTAETQARIVQAIRGGATYEAASAYGGVDYTTFRLWMRRGERSRQDDAYSEFFNAITAAEAELEVRVVATWQQAIPQDWHAARDFLARRFPKRWSGTDGVLKQLDLTRLTDRQLERLAGGDDPYTVLLGG